MSVTIKDPPLLTGVRAALTTTLTAEFRAEVIDFQPIKMSPNAATNQPMGAVFSLGWEEISDVNEVAPRFGVQIFDQWGPAVDGSGQGYDPTLVESWLERAVVALKANEHGAGYWFLRVPTASISDDAAGNPTQVELVVVVRTDNPFGF